MCILSFLHGQLSVWFFSLPCCPALLSNSLFLLRCVIWVNKVMMMMMMMMMMILRRLHCLSGFYFFVNLWSLFTNVVSDFVSDTERLSESR